jgi:hypothetical protein
MEDRVTRLQNTIYGAPGIKPLRQDIIDYVDTRDEHKSRNNQEDLALLRTEMNLKHEENKSTRDDIAHIRNQLSEWTGVITAGKWLIPLVISLLTVIVAMIAVVLKR